METLSMLLTTAPLIASVVLALGIDPVWLGLLLMMLLVRTDIALRLPQGVQ